MHGSCAVEGKIVRGNSSTNCISLKAVRFVLDGFTGVPGRYRAVYLEYKKVVQLFTKYKSVN
jgi:hypothetical protein